MRRLPMGRLLAGVVLAGTLGAPLAMAQGYPPPPPPRYERIPPPPGGAYTWRPGYWNWNGRQYAWVGGGYVVRRQGYHAWAPGAWGHGPDGRPVWRPAHWN